MVEPMNRKQELQIDRFDLIADLLHAIGEDFHALNDRVTASEYLQDAIRLCRQSGDKLHEKQLRVFMTSNLYPIPNLSDKEDEDEK